MNIDAWLEKAFDSALVEEGVQARSQDEAKQFWKLRESIAEVLASMGLNHSNDISLPIINLENFLQEWKTLFASKYPHWELFIFGHIGDGNLHIHALKPEKFSKEEFLVYTHQVDADLFQFVIKYKGSISAEHGIGLLKKPHISYSGKK